MEWKKYKLGEIGNVCMCKRILKEQTSLQGEIPFYKIGTFGKEADVFISRSLFNEYKLKYSFPSKGDILISAAGTIGRTVVYNGEEAYFQDSNIVWINNDETKVLNSFLFYVLKSVNWHCDKGSTILRLYNDNIRNTEIQVPSLEEQHKIGELLSNLDRKIALNKRINHNLEAMITCITDKLILSQKQALPQKQIGEIATIKAGGDCPSDYTKVSDSIHAVPIYSNGTENKGLYGFTSTSVITKRSITIAARGTIGYCERRKPHYVPIIRLLSVVPHDEGIDTYLHQIISRIKFKKNGSVQQQLTVPELSVIKVPYPPKDTILEFEMLTRPLILKIEQNETEIENLTKQREELLPLLMNGQATVNSD